MGIEPTVDLEYVPVDFERQTLRAGLEDAGFDFNSPAVFAWATMYLTLDAIEATLSTIQRAAPDSAERNESCAQPW